MGALKLIHSIAPHFYEKFTPAGYKVEVIPFESPTDGKNAVVTKSVDFGMFGIAAATLGAAAGEPVVVIAGACNKGMARDRRQGRRRSRRSRTSRASGRIWPGSTQEVFILERLRMEGMSIKDITPVRVSFSEMHLALARGDVDAYVGAEPGPGVSLASGVGKLVEYPYGTAMGALNMVFGAHRDTLAQKPELVQRHPRHPPPGRPSSPWRTAPSMVAMAVAKLGQKREAIEVSVPNVELTWKFDATEIAAGQDLRRAHAGAEADPAAAGLRHLLRHRASSTSSPSKPEHRAPTRRRGRSRDGSAGERARSPLRRELWRPLCARSGARGAVVPLAVAGGLALRDLRPEVQPDPAAERGRDRAVRSRVRRHLRRRLQPRRCTIHLLASMSRVYGGFALARAGRAAARAADRPHPAGAADCSIRRFQVLRPIPVTAWLPLSMILFGLGPRSAFFLVFLGAFYPILLNTIFGVRWSIRGCSRRPRMLGCQGTAQFFKVVLPAAPARDLHRPAARPRLRLGRDRGRRDDRRADRARRHHHGGAPALAHRDRDLRHDRHRHRRLHLRPARACCSASRLLRWSPTPWLKRRCRSSSSRASPSTSSFSGQRIEALRDANLARQQGRVRLPDRRLGLRQVDAAAHRRRLRDSRPRARR